MRPRRRAVAAAIAATAVTAGVVIAAWAVVGPAGFVFAWVCHCMSMFWVSVSSELRVAPLTHGWFRVRVWECTVYPAAGVHLYGRVLDAVGWNRFIARSRGFSGTRAGLPELDQHTRRSEAGHLLCLVVTAILAGAVVWTGPWRDIRWLAGLAILLHLYPVMLQRLLRARIQAALRPPAGP